MEILTKKGHLRDLALGYKRIVNQRQNIIDNELPPYIREFESKKVDYLVNKINSLEDSLHRQVEILAKELEIEEKQAFHILENFIINEELGEKVLWDVLGVIKTDEVTRFDNEK